MYNYNKKTVCFTGHRSQNLPFGFNEQDPRCLKMKTMLKRKITDLIINDDISHFISGMAIGVDMICAEIVLELRDQYPNISLECAIPCKNQPDKWSNEMKCRYFNILSSCDVKTVLQNNYTYDCMQNRNKYMVDKSDIVIAVWNGIRSGTGNTVDYARRMGRKIFVLNPDKL